MNMLSKTMDEKWSHYREIGKTLGLEAVWDVYDAENLSDRHPYEKAQYVRYGNIVKEVRHPTWVALYVAANEAILESGDLHHVFIERIRPSNDNPSILEITTGS